MSPNELEGVQLNVVDYSGIRCQLVTSYTIAYCSIACF